MKATQRAKARLPTINPDDIAKKAADKAVEKIDKDKKYAIAITTNKKFALITNVLAKNAARVKKVEQKVNDKETKRPEATKGATLASLASSMNVIASSLDRINVLLAKTLGAQTPSAAPAQQAPEAEPTAVRVTQKEDTGGLFNMLKSLFVNPAVVAALAGIVYTVLPKEMQDKVKELLSGFGVGIEEAMGKNEEEGLGGFNTALKAAGIALTTYFGAKMIASIADAISTTLKIVKVFGGGKLGRGALVLGGAAAAGAIGAAVLSKSKDDEGKPEAAPSPSGSAPGGAPAPEATSEGKPSSSGTGLRPGGGGPGLKPGGGGFGIKVPEMNGEDKPIMDMIKRHEGVRTKPYKDSLGLWTVGVGHLIGDGKSLPPEWNRELSMNEVDSLFAQDYKHHKDAAEKIPGYDKLNSSGKAALTDLTFNMGPGWYKKWPNFTKALASGDSESAAKSLEDSKWYTQVGNRAKTIVAMIRGGAQDVGNMLKGGSQMAANAPGEGTERVASSSNKGEQVKSLSQDIKVAVTTPKVETNVNSINGSKMEAANQTKIDPDSIPSPIAVRGSLAAFTKHATAGIPMAT